MAYARSYRSSRGGFLSGLVRGVGRVAGAVLRNVPGPIGMVATALTPSQRQAAAPVLSVAPGGSPLAPTPRQKQRGVLQTGVSPLGTVGVRFGSSRRMNAGNAKAARRAIRRIKSVRNLLQSIERELPRRPAARSSAGVITRREAMRALSA